jgi:hypothetical protein
LTINHPDKSNRLAVRVSPSASRSEVIGLKEGVLQVRIAAPPVKGKANRELIDFLSRALGVRKSAVSIVKGETSRNKVIAIAGKSREEVIRRLSLK